MRVALDVEQRKFTSLLAQPLLQLPIINPSIPNPSFSPLVIPFHLLRFDDFPATLNTI